MPTGPRHIVLTGDVDLSPDGFTPTSIDLPTVRLTQGGVATVLSKGADYLRPTGKKYYVAPDGSDSNDGLTPEAPLASIQTAANKSDVDEVIVAAGFYDFFQALKVSPTRDISVICEDGQALVGTTVSKDWSADTTYTNSYRVSQTSTYTVCDLATLDASGLPVHYAEQATEAEVDAIPGSWWTDGSTVLMRPETGRVADTDIRVAVSTQVMYFAGVNAYLENISVFAGRGLVAINETTTRTRIAAKNCTFTHSSANGFGTAGAIDSVVEDCEASANVADGFNYHYSATTLLTPSAVEVNCGGTRNGETSTTNINNGSSMHEAGSIIRVACEYTNNRGANIVDVGGSESWNIVCKASDSTGGPGDDYDWEIEGTLWCDACAGVTFNKYTPSDELYVTAGMSPDISPDGIFKRKFV